MDPITRIFKEKEGIVEYKGHAELSLGVVTLTIDSVVRIHPQPGLYGMNIQVRDPITKGWVEYFSGPIDYEAHAIPLYEGRVESVVASAVSFPNEGSMEEEWARVSKGLRPIIEEHAWMTMVGMVLREELQENLPPQ